jgi:hypothetical protein
MNTNQLGKIVKISKQFESILQNNGAFGKGLHQKISSLESDLPRPLVKRLRWIATIRNKAVHEEDFKLENASEFFKVCKTTLKELKTHLGGPKSKLLRNLIVLTILVSAVYLVYNFMS